MSHDERPAPPAADPSLAEVAADIEHRDHRPHAGLEQLLNRVRELVHNARAMPMSSSVMINRDEVLELLDDAIEQLPEELRAARWLLKEREEFLARTRREGDDIEEAARAKAERMVQRTEVVKAAEHRARAIVEKAEVEALQMRHECEDYCDQRLARFENILQQTLHVVGVGRERLAPSVVAASPVEAEPAEDPSGFFDQDQT